MVCEVVFVAARATVDGVGYWAPVGRLDRLASGYLFRYVKGVHDLPGFRPFPTLADLNLAYESDELFPLFSNRLMVPRRPEYEDYLAAAGLQVADAANPLAVLAVTEGVRATDNLEVFARPQLDANQQLSLDCFVHGLGYRPPSSLERVARLMLGEHLVLRHEPDNPDDPNAVAADTLEAQHLGYLPRYLAREIYPYLADPTATVRVLSTHQPLSMQLLIRVQGTWTSHAEPCSGGLFEPLVSAAALAAVGLDVAA